MPGEIVVYRVPDEFAKNAHEVIGDALTRIDIVVGPDGVFMVDEAQRIKMNAMFSVLVFTMAQVSVQAGTGRSFAVSIETIVAALKGERDPFGNQDLSGLIDVATDKKMN